MIILAILVTLAAIGAMCWLLFALAVFALPFLIGFTAAGWAHTSGAGWLGALIIGFVGAGAILIIGQLLLAFARPLWLKLLIAIAFVTPAAIAGFYATHGVVKHAVPSETWQLVLSVIGAIAIGVVAFAQVTTMGLAAPGPAGRNVSRA
ncbi:hypothetical protein GCM10010994_59970 [Chelatococcus reniformis]|uniref:DUF4175 domain-containing protein n=1 Tax=Chelatococcus reniformis TaxID=1494448 RepID=A0A916UZQ5_9HYPH|nr:hypothetical protein [Chelatococcus reniformis]GGC94186.1 hypothetical protein GCM10010994_59970 [Chelatococcus reniformis]